MYDGGSEGWRRSTGNPGGVAEVSERRTWGHKGLNMETQVANGELTDNQAMLISASRLWPRFLFIYMSQHNKRRNLILFF